MPGLFFVGYRFDLSAGLPYFKTEARRVARIIATTKTRIERLSVKESSRPVEGRLKRIAARSVRETHRTDG